VLIRCLERRKSIDCYFEIDFDKPILCIELNGGKVFLHFEHWIIQKKKEFLFFPRRMLFPTSRNKGVSDLMSIVVGMSRWRWTSSINDYNDMIIKSYTIRFYFFLLVDLVLYQIHKLVVHFHFFAFQMSIPRYLDD
jgi:hypothetical protein